jgi:4'-phosphopantetheinyl transferase EntD
VSLSHTAGFTASAVATSAIALGVDVEREDRPLPRQIRPAAADLVIEASLGRRFPDIGTWTARESVGKALGFGLLATWDVYELAGVTALGVDRPVWQVEFRALPFMRSHVWSPCAGAVMALATSTAVELPVVLAAIDALQLTIDDRPALSAT